MKVEKIYVYGYGNPGRSDDGLGAAIIKKLEDEKILEVVTDCNYQLNIEDADNISSSDVVIFVDASIEAKEPFEFRGLSLQQILLLQPMPCHRNPFWLFVRIFMESIPKPMFLQLEDIIGILQRVYLQRL